VLLVIPPQHEFPTTDDWVYAGSVRDMLRTGTFIMPDSQANLVGLTLWGALWSLLFGFSITTLTYSVLALALLSLLAFYGLARAAGVAAPGALLGTALLGLNPLFLHLSYSFMTDVPFLALVLLACYCYMRGLQGDHLLWVWLGGLLAGGAFLIRQFGVLVPLAFLGYLAVDGILTRRWRPAAMSMTAAVPLLIVLAWWVWARDFPPAISAVMAADRTAHFVFKEPWLRVFVLRTLTLLPLTAFSAWAALTIPRARWWLVPAWFLGLVWGMDATDLPGETWIAITEPPFTAQLGPFAYRLPHEPFSFGAYGNIVRVTGLDFDEYGYVQQPVWSPEVWRALFMTGVALVSGLLAALSSRFWDGIRGRSWRRGLPASAALYGLGLLTCGVTLGLAGDLFDRYVIAYLPFLILFVVWGAASWGRRGWAYSLAALLLLGTFSVAAKADQMEHNRTRWAAAAWMEARVGAVRAGWNWDHWGHQDSDQYAVSDVPLDGFRVEQQFPYLSRLSGFRTRYVLAQARADMPPVPDPAGPPAAP
ncbi:MAG TPA: glycosyltransferase family 39 protein, partial [Chloroflexia bacterium]|nr:glycosyltransferase family 39 protein [Chloroflexia bacterium]